MKVNDLVERHIIKKPIIYIDEDTQQQRSHYTPFNDEISEMSDEFAHMIVNYAPCEIKKIVAKIKKPVSSNYMPTRLLLLGQPGTGKTTLAKAIAITTKRRYRFEKAPSLLDQYKNSAIQNLDVLFKSLFKSKQDCVLILDEFDVITDLFKTDKHDKEAVDQFWQLLDDCSLKKNVLFIGTTNKSYYDFPGQIQTRFIKHRHVVTLTHPSLIYREQLIRHYLKNVSHELSDKFIKALAKQSMSKSNRELEMLMHEVIGDAELRGDDQLVLVEEDFEQDLKNWNNWRDWFSNFYQKMKPRIRIFFNQGLPTVISILNLYLNQRNFYIQLKKQSDQFATQLHMQRQSFNHQLEQSNLHNNIAIYSDKNLKDKVFEWKRNKELISCDTQITEYLENLKKENF
jgi:AAA+ superfamily predicted ATPase